MNDETAQKLKRINERFYVAAAGSFSETRRTPWPGWQRLAGLLRDAGASPGPLRVIDVGCGNGRFGRFLESAWSGPIDYLGVDLSEPLLAEVVAADWTHTEPRVLLRDIAGPGWTQDLGTDGFYLVVAFGLFHHVPQASRRTELLRDLGRLLAPAGCLVVTLWQFMENPRLRGRVLPWASLDAALGGPLDLDVLERGDHLLGWGTSPGPVRYCHHFDDEEIATLVGASDLDLVESYQDDGPGRGLNRYLVFRASVDDPSAVS